MQVPEPTPTAQSVAKHSLAHEHLLHKVVACSAFLFALSVLPLAQYVFVDQVVPTTATSEQGQVAGVSTTRESIPTALTCAEQTTQVADLQKWLEGRRSFILSEQDKATKGYTDAIALLESDTTRSTAEKEQEIASIQSLIAGTLTPYTKRLQQSETAVADQIATIQASPCINE